jgi:hypothetical protein
VLSLPRPGHGLLRCPVCRLELTTAAGALVCRNRHSFDLAREGYVNLLSSRKRQPASGGDSPEQLLQIPTKSPADSEMMSPGVPK